MDYFKTKSALTSTTSRLAGNYLMIIMVMSIGFSVALYDLSSNQLGRQLPPDSLFQQNQAQAAPPPSINYFFKQRINQGRRDLLERLVLLNVASLLFGSALSYLLAWRTLQPIEQAMEAQVQFVSDASHELRTPLTALQVSSEVALRKPKLSIQDAKNLIEQNMKDISKLKDLSDGLLNLAQVDNDPGFLKPKAVLLSGVLDKAIDQVAPLADKRSIKITTDELIAADQYTELYVKAYEPGLLQALVIVLDNAVKYSDERSSIEVTAETTSRQVRLTIKDHGIGIKVEDLQAIFRRFYRADNARSRSYQGGYGLGLAIARDLMERQQGRLTVQSVFGSGSSFTLTVARASVKS